MSVNKSQVRKVLSNCVFNPREPGFLKPIVDTVNEHPGYALMRAKELISEYQGVGNLEKIELAIQLLALYKAGYNGPTEEDGPIQA